MGRPARNPNDEPPRDWTLEETAQIRLYSVHLGWLQERIFLLAAHTSDLAAFRGPINIAELRAVLQRLARLRTASAEFEQLFAMLAAKRANLTQRDIASALNLSPAPVNRWSQAFHDPEDFEPSALTARLDLQDWELVQLVAYHFGWTVDYATYSWGDGPEEYECMIFTPDGKPLDMANRLAQAMRLAGWITGDSPATVDWRALPEDAPEALSVISYQLNSL